MSIRYVADDVFVMKTLFDVAADRETFVVTAVAQDDLDEFDDGNVDAAAGRYVGGIVAGLGSVVSIVAWFVEGGDAAGAHYVVPAVIHPFVDEHAAVGGFAPVAPVVGAVVTLHGIDCKRCCGCAPAEFVGAAVGDALVDVLQDNGPQPSVQVPPHQRLAWRGVSMHDID